MANPKFEYQNAWLNPKHEYLNPKQIQMFQCSNIKTVEQNNCVIASEARRFVIASPQGVAIPSLRSPRRFAPRDDNTF
ncbi:MAG: hypothetical protein PHU49_08525 [Syntrophorhabdaceae bacterium]|jgi:hypothetical protein|nr:hypothetical protein [Syntrophorhabdaceae bacterium]